MISRQNQPQWPIRRKNLKNNSRWTLSTWISITRKNIHDFRGPAKPQPPAPKPSSLFDMLDLNAPPAMNTMSTTMQPVPMNTINLMGAQTYGGNPTFVQPVINPMNPSMVNPAVLAPVPRTSFPMQHLHFTRIWLAAWICLEIWLSQRQHNRLTRLTLWRSRATSQPKPYVHP